MYTTSPWTAESPGQKTITRSRSTTKTEVDTLTSISDQHQCQSGGEARSDSTE